MEEDDHLIAGPVLVVDAGVDDEANGAPHFVFQPAVLAIGILIASDLFAQPF